MQMQNKKKKVDFIDAEVDLSSIDLDDLHEFTNVITNLFR